MKHRITAISFLLLISSLSLCAQPTPPSAPLPEAVINAQKIFLGNAGETDNQDCLRAYNEFYAALKGDGHFKLFLDPASAELILELHYEIRPGQITGRFTDVDTKFARQFRLVLIDPHTHAVLWSLTEVENDAILQSNRDKNLDAAVLQLYAAFKALNQLNYTVPMPPSGKSRLSDEGKK